MFQHICDNNTNIVYHSYIYTNIKVAVWQARILIHTSQSKYFTHHAWARHVSYIASFKGFDKSNVDTLFVTWKHVSKLIVTALPAEVKNLYACLKSGKISKHNTN